MTPGEVRDELVTIQQRLREVETAVETQKSANPGYIVVCHETTEAWEATDRAIERLDEMAMGLS